MKLICALALALALQTYAALAEPLQRSPDIRQQERHIAPAPMVHPRVYAPRRVVAPGGAPLELLPRTPVQPSATATQHPPAADGGFPGLVRVPSVSSLPGMRKRPIARHVRTHGIDFVYVPEDEYPELFAMLTSDDPDQVEAAYERLQQLASVQ
jgi:hypothetical protein